MCVCLRACSECCVWSGVAAPRARANRGGPQEALVARRAAEAELARASAELAEVAAQRDTAQGACRMLQVQRCIGVGCVGVWVCVWGGGRERDCEPARWVPRWTRARRC